MKHKTGRRNESDFGVRKAISTVINIVASSKAIIDREKHSGKKIPAAPQHAAIAVLKKIIGVKRNGRCRAQ